MSTSQFFTAPHPFNSDWAGARVLVAGGLGLIGSHLARKLTSLGAEVLLLDNLNSGCGGNMRNIADLDGRVDIVYADINDPTAVHAAIIGRDYIFHLAGLSSHIESMRFPLDDLQANCGGTLTLLEACRQSSSIAGIVFGSTRQVYGRPRYLPVDEEHPINPIDVNGIHRIAAEHYHILYRQVYGLNTRILRFANTYGPGMRIKDERQMFLGIWLRNVILGQSIQVWGGQQRRDLLHVEDAVEALLMAAKIGREFPRQIFNIGGSAEISLQKLAQMIIEENDGVGSYILTEFPETRKLIDIGDHITNDRMFRQATGWAPTIQLAMGLRKTISYYRDNISYYL